MTTPSGGLVGSASIRVTADTDPAFNAIRAFGTLAQRSLSEVGRSAGSAALSLGSIGAAAGSAVPLLAGAAAAAANLAPAATAGATALLAVQQASAVVQLGMIGVEDAISAAFATGEGSAEEFEEALNRLAPSAQNFVLAVRSMRDEFGDFQQSIQEELFTELDAVFLNTAQSVLPVLQDNLIVTADIINNVAAQSASAAAELAEDGTFGQALAGANEGLLNLSGIAPQIVTALGQLAAAGAPAFDRLTEAAADAATNIADRLSEGFETGELQESVETAVDLLFELANIAEDAFGIVQNALGAVSSDGDEVVGVLGEVVSIMNDVSATEEFQGSIASLAAVMGDVATTVGPLLITALSAISPVIANLAPPLQTLVAALGAGLTPVVDALVPVLITVSEVFGQIINAVSPLFPVIGQLVAQLGAILTPILQTVGNVVEQLAPLFLDLVTVIAGALNPILAQLPIFLQPILDAFEQLVTAVIPLLNEVIVALTPVLGELSVTFVDLLIALEPVITSLLLLATEVLVALTPVLIPIINLLVQLNTIFVQSLVPIINGIVIPALNALAALLRGDFSGALRGARQLVTGFVNTVVQLFTGLPQRIFQALSSLAGVLYRAVREAFNNMVRGVRDGINAVLRAIRSIPRLALGALAGIGGLLYNSGRALVQGFIDGIRSLFGSLRDAVGSLMDIAGNFFPGSPAEVGPFSGQGYVLLRGRRLSEEFAQGIADNEAEVRTAALNVVTAAVPEAPPLGAGILPLGAVPGAPVLPAAPVQISLTLVNQGVLGSRVEVLDWLTQALDDLRRQQRLGVTL